MHNTDTDPSHQPVLQREVEALRERVRELESNNKLCVRHTCSLSDTHWPELYKNDDNALDFKDVFNVDALQSIQDAFAAATNVASIITDVKGRPITRPSGFCRLCRDVVRRSPKGLANCIRSDASFGSDNPLTPLMRPCLSSGLWDGGTSIYVGERHVANWVVGQVRIEDDDIETLRDYAREIDVDEALYAEALAEVPSMPREQFMNVCKALCLIANQISTLAQQNYLQARAIEMRRQAETALRESETRFRQFSKATFEGIFVHKGGVILDVNKAGCELVGLEQETLIGHSMNALMPSLAGLNKDEGVQDVRVAELVRPDGETRICELRERDTFFKGGQVQVLVVRDITKRIQSQREAKEKQQQLIQADKMVSLGILVAGMAHEINNPNSFMTLNLPLVLDVWEDITPILEEYYRENGDFIAGGLEYTELRETIPELLSRMHEGASRIRGIVGSLKDFSRNSPDEFRWDIDINEVVRGSLELVGSLVVKSTSRFQDMLAPELPAVTANPQKISQVLINLLVNACEALTGREQAITLHTAYDVGKDEVVIRVRDEGAGIPEELMTKIMDPFFTTKREDGGTGLGLSVSSAIVEEHGGALMFTSKPGQGTTAELRLPASDQISDKDAYTTRNRPSGSSIGGSNAR
ncbi:PocR ligand-binding domain-containing protein [Pseudodesulfovibrio sediminis]|uniref:histidine kinase n=1 Tax=Pseudodesulfovibrio sediminis TaxID=2810563 RepID=A0ABM7P8U7_9BACT|nr:PocR ligand-binding domain-containing protein [Pseudodesulfovibrio sediminis]BCS89840.1 hypothetical protein PSDVSF_30820 [Pseudodesulfovibrio sediminis]